MERKKRSKGRGWESCYVKKIYGTFGVEMRVYGQKFVQFCKHTHTHTHTHARARARVSYSSIDKHVTIYPPLQALAPTQSSTSFSHDGFLLALFLWSLTFPSSLFKCSEHNFFVKVSFRRLCHKTRWRDNLIRHLGPAWTRIARDRCLWRQFREGFLLTEWKKPWW